MKIEQQSVVTWDPGVYEAKVKSVEPIESTFPGKEGTPRFKFVLRVTSHDGEEFNDLWYFTGTTLSKHPNALLRPFVRALLPEANLDDPDLDLDTDALIGKRCRVSLGINEEKGRNTIDKVYAAEPRKAAAAISRPAAKAAVEEVDESEGAKPF